MNYGCLNNFVSHGCEVRGGAAYTIKDTLNIFTILLSLKLSELFFFGEALLL